MDFIKKQDIIDTDKNIITKWNRTHSSVDKQYFCVRDDVFDEIFKIVDNVGDKSSTRSNLILKTAYLMGAISWAQPFCDGNKRAGLLVTATILYRNGIEFEPHNENEIVDLLWDIQEDRCELNQQIMDKIILYISQNIV